MLHKSGPKIYLVHIESGRGFRCAELIQFGLQHICSLCFTHIAHITEDNSIWHTKNYEAVIHLIFHLTSKIICRQMEGNVQVHLKVVMTCA